MKANDQEYSGEYGFAETVMYWPINHMVAPKDKALSCEDCHGEVAEAYAGTPMSAVGVDCVDCHMPYASKSAVAFNPNRGDVRTHLFSINVDKGGEMFTVDGGAVLLDEDGQGAVTLNFACGDCHPDKGTNWLAGKAKNFHQRGTKLAAGD